MRALFEDIRRFPPLEISVAAFIGYKPSKDDRVSFDEFRAMFPNGMMG